MLDYTDKVMEFFYNPRNQGTITEKKSGEAITDDILAEAEIVQEQTIAVEAIEVAISKSKIAYTTCLTNLQKITFIKKTLEEEVKPALAQDGGDVDLFIDLFDVELVKVTLKEACGSRASSAATPKNTIEFKYRIFPELVVVSV
ncbi:MAG: NifU family protein [cyanobacterium endosymbiont of Epithemia adnata isolate EadnSB Bon19]